MLNLNVMLLAFLVLAATDVFAARISYSAKYKDGHKKSCTSKNAEILDNKEELILDNIKE